MRCTPLRSRVGFVVMVKRATVCCPPPLRSMTRSAKRMSFTPLPDRNAEGIGETLHVGQ